MAKIMFKELTSNQNILFPVSLSEKIASNHPRSCCKLHSGCPGYKLVILWLRACQIVVFHHCPAVTGTGHISLDVQYIDGTKAESASNRYTCVWRGSMDKNKAKLELKIQAALREGDRANNKCMPVQRER